MFVKDKTPLTARIAGAATRPRPSLGEPDDLVEKRALRAMPNLASR